jgi:hypothetical protein
MHKYGNLWYSDAMVNIGAWFNRRIKPLNRLFQPQQFAVLLLVWFVAFHAPIVCIIHCQLLNHSHAAHLNHAHMQHAMGQSHGIPSAICIHTVTPERIPGLPPISALPPVQVDALPGAFVGVIPGVLLLGVALLLASALPSLYLPPPTPPPRSFCP